MNKVIIADASDSDCRLMSGLLMRAGYELRQSSGEDTRHHRPIWGTDGKTQSRCTPTWSNHLKDLGQGGRVEATQICQLATLDRKITAELAPTHEVPDDRKGVNHDENDGTEVKHEQSTQPQPEVKTETTVNTVNVNSTDTPQGHKPSMVAEPQPRYPMPASMPRFPARHPGIWQSTTDSSGFNGWSVYCFMYQRLNSCNNQVYS